VHGAESLPLQNAQIVDNSPETTVCNETPRFVCSEPFMGSTETSITSSPDLLLFVVDRRFPFLSPLSCYLTGSSRSGNPAFRVAVNFQWRRRQPGEVGAVLECGAASERADPSCQAPPRLLRAFSASQRALRAPSICKVAKVTRINVTQLYSVAARHSSNARGNQCI